MSSRSPLRVAVWSTGAIGRIAIGTVHRRADMDLVGVWVHSPDKEGRDAGELAGIGPVGVAATNDTERILAERPDCVVYAASGPELDAAAVPDYVRLLDAGVNVVTVTSWGLVYPPAYQPAWRGQLAEAARRGGASLYASGIEPGFAADQLPLVLTTMSNTVRSIRASEFALYDRYPVEFILRDVMGFGRPLDFPAVLAQPGALAATWGPSLRLVAHALGAELDEVRELFDRAPTDRKLEVACGTIDAGTCGAVRTQAIGVVDGKDAFVIEHVNRMAPDVAPEWPHAEDGTYRIVIDGDPPIDCTMKVGSGTEEAMVATAMRIVNAVPYVVAAEPGLVSSLDIPLTVPRASVV
jgi:2,4-diaminopentanoate dehydrogenase